MGGVRPLVEVGPHPRCAAPVVPNPAVCWVDPLVVLADSQLWLKENEKEALARPLQDFSDDPGQDAEF